MGGLTILSPLTLPGPVPPCFYGELCLDRFLRLLANCTHSSTPLDSPRRTGPFVHTGPAGKKRELRQCGPYIQLLLRSTLRLDDHVLCCWASCARSMLIGYSTCPDNYETSRADNTPRTFSFGGRRKPLRDSRRHSQPYVPKTSGGFLEEMLSCTLGCKRCTQRLRCYPISGVRVLRPHIAVRALLVAGRWSFGGTFLSGEPSRRYRR